MCCLYTSSLTCISTAFGLPSVQSEHAPTDTAPVPVHFRFLFRTPLHRPVQAAVSRRVVHHAFAVRCSAWPAVTHPVTLCANCRHRSHRSLCRGTVVQVFSSLRGLVLDAPITPHCIVAAPCHVPLPSGSKSSDSVLVLSVTLVGTGHQARASVVDLWTRDVCSDCVSLFPAAQV